MGSPIIRISLSMPPKSNSKINPIIFQTKPDPLIHLGKTLCIASVMMRWMATFVDHLLLSLIAFSRFILLRNPTLGKTLFDGQGGNSMRNLWLAI